jgi:hypothetical protein
MVINFDGFMPRACDVVFHAAELQSRCELAGFWATSVKDRGPAPVASTGSTSEYEIPMGNTNERLINKTYLRR